MLRTSLMCGAAVLSVAVLASETHAGTIQEPPLFASQNGVLDLLVIAAPQRVTNFTQPGFTPVGWAYEVCMRPDAGNACPPGTTGLYGGFRLGLQPGDLLKMRLVNQLPPVKPATLASYVYDPLLALNPTNLHVHGLVVEATANSVAPPTVPVYGDFIFTSVFNPANGNPANYSLGTYNKLHQHVDVIANGVVDYHIQLPANHPSGAYWLHPHMHGNAMNQLAAGLSGIISVGSVGKYACYDAPCTSRVSDGSVRHLILKDMQVMPGPNGGAPMFQEDPAFCQATPMPGEAARNGVCAGDPASYRNGAWFFSVNGQQFPTIPVAGGDGEIWRLQNASGSATYDIQLTNDQTSQPMIMQLLSVDGVSIAIPPGTTPGEIVALGAARFHFATCPAASTMLAASGESPPVCVTDLVMMPSARAEIWAVWRGADGNVAAAPAGATATLRTVGFSTGPSGDTWPAVNLAKVQFPAGQAPRLSHGALNIHGDALATMQPGGLFETGFPVPPGAGITGCKALAPGHHRRIYFGNPTLASAPHTPGVDQYGNSVFGLGYEEIDQNGAPVPGTLVDLTMFDPANVICLPLGPGNRPVTEVWEIINLATELHNFHIHQTKFRVVNASAPQGSLLSPNSTQGGGVMEDNVPLPYAVPGPLSQAVRIPGSGSCTIADYKAGNCAVTPVVVQIPFAMVGEFVYHCHILDHEDGGMMHAIQVVPSVISTASGQ